MFAAFNIKNTLLKLQELRYAEKVLKFSCILVAYLCYVMLILWMTVCRFILCHHERFGQHCLRQSQVDCTGW